MKNGNGRPLLRVLLVEDSSDDEQLLLRELTKTYKVICHRVETEASMQLALDTRTWDVIICDYKMPHLSPFRALELLKASRKGWPFIVISGAVDSSVAIQIMLAGARDFVEKSNLSRLTLAIQRELRSLGEKLQAEIDIESTLDETIHAWGKALELRDHWTSGHTQRVTDLTLRLARRMDVSRDQLVTIHRGALLHDVGKMGIRDAVLFKEGPLDQAERKIMELHPQLAYDMLSPIPLLKDAINIPYCHHERFDGSGYPQQLAGRAIPFEARLFAVVDVFDALTSDRPYRKSWTTEKAIDYIKEHSGTLFDPTVVDSFLALLAENGNGNSYGR